MVLFAEQVKAINYFHKNLHLRCSSSKCASVACLSGYKGIFLGILWNVHNILSVEQLWTTFSKLFNNFV